jgi:hypothetical protein
LADCLEIQMTMLRNIYQRLHWGVRTYALLSIIRKPKETLGRSAAKYGHPRIRIPSRLSGIRGEECSCSSWAQAISSYNHCWTASVRWTNLSAASIRGFLEESGTGNHLERSGQSFDPSEVVLKQLVGKVSVGYKSKDALVYIKEVCFYYFCSIN